MTKPRTARKIVVVTPKRSIGCASRAIETYIEQLRKNGHRITVFLLDKTPFETVTQYLENNAVDVVLTNSIYYGVGKQYTQAVDFLKFCNRRSVRVVDIAHFGKFDVVVDNLLSKRLFVSRTLLLKYVLLAQKHGLTTEKYDYLYNPVTAQKSALQNRKVGKTFVIGRVGRADGDKWDGLILDLAPLLIRKIPGCKIIIQAMPDSHINKISGKIRSQIEVLPETPRHEEVLQTIRRCDVLVQTSKIGESFGCAIAEGMALGKPIVTNSTDFLAPVFFDRDNAQTELVTDTVNGFVENSLRGMAERISMLYKDRKLYETISTANIEKARMLFDTTVLTRRLEGFLFTNTHTTFTLAQWLAEYRARTKPESWTSILKLNIGYLVRRMQRKLKHLGVPVCC